MMGRTEDSAEGIGDGGGDGTSRRRRRRSNDGKTVTRSRRDDVDVVRLSWCESAAAVTTVIMAARAAGGMMSSRDASLGVLAMWIVSLAWKTLFIGLRMDENTPPPDRMVLLFAKLFFSVVRWGARSAVFAPVWTFKAVFVGVAHRAVDRGWDESIVEEATGVTSDVRDAVSNKDYEDFASAIANDEGEWDVIASGSVGCCTYRMLRGISPEDERMMKRGLAKYRTEVLAREVPVEILFNAQVDLLGRQEWDATTLHPTCIEREDPNSLNKPFTAQDVVYWRLQYPRLMAPRDYLVARRMWRDAANDMATCICRDALSSRSAVAAKNKLQSAMRSRAVDVRSMYSAIMVGKNAEVNGSQYVSIYYEDPGVPPRLAHMAAAKNLDSYMATFDRELRRRVAANDRMKDYDAIPAPPDTHHVTSTSSFRTGRTSVPHSDDEGDVSRTASPDLVARAEATDLHFAPTNASREYRFSGRGGLGKRQRIRRKISKVLKLLSELADPTTASRGERSTEDDSSGSDTTGDRQRVRVSKWKWVRRVAVGAIVFVGRGKQ